jgi:hypothetical protein
MSRLRNFRIVLGFFLAFLSAVPSMTYADASVGFATRLAPQSMSLLYNLKRVGVSPNNVIQSHAFDKKNRKIYTIHTSKTVVRGEEYSVINRYELGQGGVETATDSSLPSDLVGHQGLAVENDDAGKTWLWSSAPSRGPDGPGGAYAVRFKYNPNGAVSDLQRFRLFPGNGSGSSTPTISHDGKYLIVKYNDWKKGEPNRSRYRIRLFDLKTLSAGGPGDYSAQPAYDWSVGPEATDSQMDIGYRAPLQNIASDGRLVYILLGTADMVHRNVVAVYTLDGKFQGLNPSVTVGKQEAANDGRGRHYEAEGLVFLNRGGNLSLTLGVASGDKGGRLYRIYEISK